MRALAMSLLCIGCAPVADGVTASAERVAPRVGEPNGTFPSAAERLGIMAINRGRSDPATVKGPQSMMYPARPPVMWSYELSRSARFHANNLLGANVSLMHTSPCPLNTNIASANCDGSVACACASPVPSMCASCANVAAVNNCGTDTFTRIGYFTAGSSVHANGEVAAAGYQDPMATVDGWMDEAAGSDGHRQNLLDVGITSTTMGYGHVEGNGCLSSFDVSDSGSGGPAAVKLPTAAVSPIGGKAGAYTFYATWADSAGAPPAIHVVVDGKCTAMTRELGSDTLNATYKASVSLAGGCHNYWVLAVDAGGARQTHPTSGAITIAAGATCGSDFLPQAPGADCEGARPADMRGAIDLGGGGNDGGGGASFDLAGGNGNGGTGGSGGGVGGNGPVPGGFTSSGGCSVGGAAPSSGLALVGLALLALVLARRSRRWPARADRSRVRL